MTKTFREHWPEYVIEAAGLGVFMVSAFGFGTILEHPASPLRDALPDPLLRRFLMGLAMGATAVAIIYSRWGKQSGAHINPATTLTFFRLGKIASWDALFYVIFQFIGGLSGAVAASLVLSAWVSHPAVNYVVTTPGEPGPFVAFGAEVGIAFVMMTVILQVSNHTRWHKFTGLCAGLLVLAYITVEAPLSGMSLNPARTFASAVPAQHWSAFWIYLSAPLAGMLAAAEVYVRRQGRQKVGCAKLHHENNARCIFCGKAARH